MTGSKNTQLNINRLNRESKLSITGRDTGTLRQKETNDGSGCKSPPKLQRDSHKCVTTKFLSLSLSFRVPFPSFFWSFYLLYYFLLIHIVLLLSYRFVVTQTGPGMAWPRRHNRLLDKHPPKEKEKGVSLKQLHINSQNVNALFSFPKLKRNQYFDGIISLNHGTFFEIAYVSG